MNRRGKEEIRVSKTGTGSDRSKERDNGRDCSSVGRNEERGKGRVGVRREREDDRIEEREKESVVGWRRERKWMG